MNRVDALSLFQFQLRLKQLKARYGIHNGYWRALAELNARIDARR